MSIYNINTDYVNEQLTPPKLRKNKFLAWLSVLAKELKIFNNLFYLYQKSDITNWLAFSMSSTYSLNDKVIYTDNNIYMYNNTTPTTGNLPNDVNYWTLVQSNFIGVDKRINANAQKMILEYTLNRYFRVSIMSPQIYIQNTVVFLTPFVMGNSGSTSSSMSNISSYQVNYLGNAYTYSSNIYDYTIYVPTVLFASLGTSTLNRENAIRSFADLYNLAGMTYQVVTY